MKIKVLVLKKSCLHHCKPTMLFSIFAEIHKVRFNSDATCRKYGDWLL